MYWCRLQIKCSLIYMYVVETDANECLCNCTGNKWQNLLLHQQKASVWHRRSEERVTAILTAVSVQQWHEVCSDLRSLPWIRPWFLTTDLMAWSTTQPRRESEWARVPAQLNFCGILHHRWSTGFLYVVAVHLGQPSQFLSQGLPSMRENTFTDLQRPRYYDRRSDDVNTAKAHRYEDVTGNSFLTS
jgi:hypothetical protein